ncbi:urease accessory protein UreD [Thermodesulfovibrio sp. Kuro-1]|uniref:urease accessory protein UreD n=1 Tax=Thermodesulfovibrio sp. Kuro-1 TaxID=2580394 RepID=UPI0011436A5A|nr:urease accessory protein UreD [Thermodesulfovibrio sp. Kuro-1]MBC7189295.1 urease accessory protein UreD [Candidatus Aerophobetes bacterium]
MIDQKSFLYLELECKDGKTYIKDCYAKSPLKIAKSLYLDDSGEAFIFIMNPSGGLLQNDNYDIKINLSSKSEAFITTQSATKIYKMREKEAYLKESFHLGKNALLEYFPDPYIPFAGSKFRTETDIKIEKGATLFMGEIIFPGRFERGETFLYDYFERKTKIFYENKLIFYDNVALRPENNLNNICIFEKYSFYGQLICTSEKIDRTLSDKIHFILQNCNSVKASSSLFHDIGIIVRMLGFNNLDINETIQKIWTILRNTLLNRPALKIRKY